MTKLNSTSYEGVNSAAFKRKVLGTFGSVAAFASKLSISPSQARNIISGRSDIALSRVKEISALLQLSNDERMQIFGF